MPAARERRSGSCGARRCSISCAPRCATPSSDESGAQEQLRSLEASNLFLIPLDRRREWYRYHALFREFLLGELRRVEPDVVTKLHLRAADWYESNGSPALALEHLLNTTERDRCVQLVTAAGPADLPGRPDVDRAAVALRARRRRHRGVSPARRAGRLGRGVDRADRRGATVGGDPRRRLVRPGARWTARRRSTRRGPCCGPCMCPAGPEQMLADASFAVAQEPPWSPWRDTALVLLRRGASAHRRRRPGRAPCSRRRPRWRPTTRNADALVLSESELALLAMDRGRWAEAAEHVERALAAIDEHRMHDYATSVLAFAAAARLAVHRGDLEEADRQLTRAMRARPSCTFALPFLAVRVRLQLAKVYWALGDHATARHLLREIDDILLHRPALGALVDEVVGVPRRSLTSSAQSGAGRRVAAHPGGASAAPVPADAPHDPRDRRAAVRLPQHRQLRGRLDLPEAGRLLTQRRGATGDGDRPARRVAALSQPAGAPRPRRCRTRAPSPASGPPRRRAGARRRERRRPARRRSRRPSRRHPPRHRPALRRTERRHRPRPARPGGPAPASSDRALRTPTPARAVSATKRASLMARRRSRSV